MSDSTISGSLGSGSADSLGPHFPNAKALVEAWKRQAELDAEAIKAEQAESIEEKKIKWREWL